MPTRKIQADLRIEEVVQVAKEVGFPLVLIPENGLSVKQTEPLEKAFHFRDTAELRKFWGSRKGPIECHHTADVKWYVFGVWCCLPPRQTHG